MENIIKLNKKVSGKEISTDISIDETVKLVLSQKVVVIKNIFTEIELRAVRKAVVDWGILHPPVTQDDFHGNYHMQKAKISNIQKVPHVFHDYNFNDFSSLSMDFADKLNLIFEPLQVYYNQLTGYAAEMGFVKGAPYLHPQLIQYPAGGGFFGRHNHNLLPQKIGFILSMSKYGQDYRGGGTCFVMNNEVVDLEGHHDIGDLCLFRFDVDHWVKQSPLDDKFSWDDENGRWVATLAYFNPFQ
jgi:hypothetical protein